jgi:hypothetical protein
MGFVKINSSSPVCLSLRVLCCPILLANGFEKTVFRVEKKNPQEISTLGQYIEQRSTDNFRNIFLCGGVL